VQTGDIAILVAFSLSLSSSLSRRRKEENDSIHRSKNERKNAKGVVEGEDMLC
jgi:hypothetical protein